MSSVNIAPTAAAVRARNAELDNALFEAITALDGVNLNAAPAAGEWTVAEILGHLSEFPRFFAGQLERFVTDPSALMGRTHNDDARLAAVGASPGLSRGELSAGCKTAFDCLAAALELLTDDHVVATTRNVKYGEEPLAEFLERYVLAHKNQHLDQLTATASAVQSRLC